MMNDKIDLRIVKTYAKLTTALEDMMSEISFDDITVFDLCEKAGVRRATFYKHFKDKYDFLKSVTAKVINDMNNSVVSSNFDPSSPVDYFTKFVNEVVVYFENRPKILSNILSSNTFPILYDIIINCTHSALFEILTNAKKYGAPFTNDISFMANFINGGIANILLNWFKNHDVSKEVLSLRVGEIIAKLF